MIVVAGGIRSKSVEAYIYPRGEIACGKWEPLPAMKRHRAKASSVVYDNCIIVIGGQGIPSTVEKFNLAQGNGMWIEIQLNMEFLSQQLYGHVCVLEHGNRLLVISGRFKDRNIYEIQQNENPSENPNEHPPYTLRLVTQMPRSLLNHCAVCCGGQVFIIGIEEDLSPNTMVVFNLTTNNCEVRMPLAPGFPGSQMAATVWGDNVVILGGKAIGGKALNTAIMFNTTTRNLTWLPPMRKKRYGFTAVTIGDNIIVMGGQNESGILRSVECYDGSKEWTELPPMIEARAYATAVKAHV